MKHLIIGGAGFIGCNLAQYLLKQNDEVIIFDNFSRKGAILNINWLTHLFNKNLEIVQGDIRIDTGRLEDLIEKVDVVYHLAAQVAVTNSIIDPREDFEINIFGTFNVLEAIRNSSNKPILIYSSTNKVYGKMEDLTLITKKSRYQYKNLPKGISEDRYLDFYSPYGCSKGAGDQYVKDYSRIYNLKTVVLRQSCIYGTRQFGIEDQGWVAWFCIASILDKTITIYGDGRQVRDILYIDDLLDLFTLVVKNIDISNGKVYNIGGGPDNTISLLELISFLEKLLNKKIKYNFSNWRVGDQAVYISDITKAKQELNWIPKIDISTGLNKLISWIKENKDIFKEWYNIQDN